MTQILIGLAVIIALFFGRIYVQNASVPTLGVTQGKLQPVSSKPNNVSSQADDEAKRVDTLAAKETAEETISALKKAVEQYGGGEIKEESTDYLYIVFTTAKMKFKDDLEFWLDKTANEVHFRSASRAGYSDMGVNRQRYEALAEIYNAQ